MTTTRKRPVSIAAAERDKKILELYKANWLLKDIAIELGTSMGAINQRLVQMRRSGKLKQRRENSAQHEENLKWIKHRERRAIVKKLRQEGQTNEDIAEHLDVHVACVKDIVGSLMDEGELPRSERSIVALMPKRERAQYVKERQERLYRKHRKTVKEKSLAGLSVEEIADELKLTKQKIRYVQRRLRQDGELPSPQEQRSKRLDEVYREHAKEIKEWRLEGWSNQRISEKLGIHRQIVGRLVRRLKDEGQLPPDQWPTKQRKRKKKQAT